jgi:hypothetical protein
METISNQNVPAPLSPKEWALTIFITSLPLIGLILLLVWAFSDDTNIHKKNWAKGTLLIMLIGIILVFGFLFLFGGLALLVGVFN